MVRKKKMIGRVQYNVINMSGTVIHIGVQQSAYENRLINVQQSYFVVLTF